MASDDVQYSDNSGCHGRRGGCLPKEGSEIGEHHGRMVVVGDSDFNMYCGFSVRKDFLHASCS